MQRPARDRREATGLLRGRRSAPPWARSDRRESPPSPLRDRARPLSTRAFTGTTRTRSGEKTPPLHEGNEGARWNGVRSALSYDLN